MAFLRYIKNYLAVQRKLQYKHFSEVHGYPTEIAEHIKATCLMKACQNIFLIHILDGLKLKHTYSQATED